jgi:hypothetical protein
VIEQLSDIGSPADVVTLVYSGIAAAIVVGCVIGVVVNLLASAVRGGGGS